MFKRLPIALTQVKAGDPIENLLNEIRQITYRAKEEIRQIIYPLYWTKKKLLKKYITIKWIQ